MAVSGEGNSTTSPMSSMSSPGTLRAAGGHRTRPTTSSCPTTPTASPDSSAPSAWLAPTSPAFRLAELSRSSSIDGTRDCLALSPPTSAYTGWAGSLPPEEVAARLEAVMRDSHLPGAEWAERWLPTLFTDCAPAGLVDELGAIIANFHPRGAQTMARAMARADLRDVLPRIDAPTLLIYGDADVRSPLSVAEELHSRIPASKLVVLQGAGHQLNMEAADQFSSALRDFLHATDQSG
jgi:pimeloyl-ACP methyl ester carboxylesterase